MTDAKREREHLAQANPHRTGSEVHRPAKGWLKKLERDGPEIDVAVSMLRTLEKTLRAFEAHRELIMKRLNDQK